MKRLLIELWKVWEISFKELNSSELNWSIQDKELQIKMNANELKLKIKISNYEYCFKENNSLWNEHQFNCLMDSLMWWFE